MGDALTTSMQPSLALPPGIIAAIEAAVIPPVPQVLLRLMEAVEDDGVSTDTLAELISRDPAISVRILTAANSAAFRRGREFVRLKDCVQVLGTRLIRTIATCLAVQQSFDPIASRSQSDLSGFWYHSLCVAEAARCLAAETRLAALEEAYLGGLLHDMGELLLLAGLPEYAEALSMCPDEASLPKIENLLFECGHEAAGAWLVNRWQLDSTLADAILFHHCAPSEIIAADSLSQIVWIAHAWVDSGRLPETVSLGFGKENLSLENALGNVCSNVARIATALGLEAACQDQSPRNAMPQVVMRNLPSSADAGISAKVRDLALMFPLQDALDTLDSDVELLRSLREAARILFGIDQLAFLFKDSGGNGLRGARDPGQVELLQRILLTIDPISSVAARAVSQDCCCTTYSAQAPPTLADTQLMRCMSAEHLICLPMRSSQGMLGVMVIGVSARQIDRFEDQMPWLASFAQLGAKALWARQGLERQRNDLIDGINEIHLQQGRRIVHEAGNPLGIIKNYLTILERKLPDSGAVKNELKVLGDEIARVVRIIDQFSMPASKAEPSGNLDRLIRETLSLYQPALLTPHGIRLDTDFAAPHAQCICRDDELRQILLNLLKNSVAALPEGGKISLTTSEDVFEGGKHYAELRLADNGPGLPPAIRERLGGNRVDAPSGRQGQGLDIVTKLVTDNQGKFICSTRPGTGTIFSILIPIHPHPTLPED